MARRDVILGGTVRSPELPGRRSRLEVRGCPSNFPPSRRFSLIIPKGDNARRKIRKDELVSIAKDIAQHFGGVTVDAPSQGCWDNPEQKRLQCERNIRMNATRNYTESDGVTLMPRDKACRLWMDDVEEINRIAEKAGRLFGQYSIYADATPVDAALIPGLWQPEIDKGLVQRAWFGLNRNPDTLKL